MLIGASVGRASSENASIRSTSRRTRSVSSTISWASGASSALAPDFRSWAAPRMPASGFLISCASMRPRPTRERRPAASWALRSLPRPFLTDRVSSTEPSPRGAAAPSASKGGRPNRLMCTPRSRTRASSSIARFSSDTRADPGGSAARKRPRARSPSPWPNSDSAASFTATSAPSASTTRAGSGLSSKAAAFKASMPTPDACSLVFPLMQPAFGPEVPRGS